MYKNTSALDSQKQRNPAHTPFKQTDVHNLLSLSHKCQGKNTPCDMETDRPTLCV